MATKLNYVVYSVSEYAPHKGQVEVHCVKQDERLHTFATGLYMTVNKGLYEVGDKVEIVVTNYTKEKEK